MGTPAETLVKTEAPTKTAEQLKLIEAVKLGLIWAQDGQEFTLASGAKSKYYIDFDKVMMCPSGAEPVISTLALKIAKLPGSCTAVGGPSSGVDPIVGALMARMPFGVYGFKVRKEPKGRGPAAGEMVEGYLKAGDNAIVIEDVTTSGGSVLKAIQEVEKLGAKVIKVITILDRLAGAKDKLSAYDFESLLTINDLGIV